MTRVDDGQRRGRPHFLTPLFESRGPVGLRIERTGEWLVRVLETALDSRSRTRGLLGRDGLAPGSGLVIAPSQGIHTFGMRFALDIVGLARDGRVVTCRAAVQPRRVVFAWSAFAMLEIPPGEAGRASLRVGDRLVVAPLSEPPAAD